MQVNDFLAISVVGSFLSLIIQWAKDKYGTESYATKLFTIFFAILFGTVYYYLRSTDYFVTVIGVLMAASTFYAFFLK